MCIFFNVIAKIKPCFVLECLKSTKIPEHHEPDSHSAEQKDRTTRYI